MKEQAFVSLVVFWSIVALVFLASEYRRLKELQRIRREEHEAIIARLRRDVYREIQILINDTRSQ